MRIRNSPKIELISSGFAPIESPPRAAPAILRAAGCCGGSAECTRDLKPQAQISILHQAQEPRGSGIEMQMRAWNTLHVVILDVEVLSPKSRKDSFDAIDGNFCPVASRTRHSNNQI